MNEYSLRCPTFVWIRCIEATFNMLTNRSSNSSVFFRQSGNYAGVHITNFKDMVLRPELLTAISECGFENPSEGLLPPYL